ncbi:DUF6788 family protein [Leptolyngbya sp. AN03gr2]|uniref:DUF6788 family protein n=1 Tax=unclassified Leptolyngbya TaxID=2650499 RepID=UPI003D314913
MTDRIKLRITQDIMPRRSSIASLQASINRLTPDEQQQLYRWLGKRLQENTMIAADVAENSIETRNYQGKTYVLQKRRCGKISCPCMEGEISEVGHGPYWYAYWHEQGRTKNKYIGKRPPWQND